MRRASPGSAAVTSSPRSFNRATEAETWLWPNPVRWWTSLIELSGCVITSSSTSRPGHSSVEVTRRYTLASAAETADALEHVTIDS